VAGSVGDARTSDEDKQARLREEQALALLTARVAQEPNTYVALAEEILDDLGVVTDVSADPFSFAQELLERLMGMTELAVWLLGEFHEFVGKSMGSPSTADTLRELALFLASKDLPMG